MKILFVADGRSPTAINWIRHFTETGHEVHLASLYPSSPDLILATYHTIPFSLSGGGASSEMGGASLIRKLIPPSLRTKIRQILAPSQLDKSVQALKLIINEINPDLVHALRIPYEGMVAAMSDPAMPLIISVWGNDFTLHAVSSDKMGELTRQAMKRTGALMADCQRDIRLAHEWGLSSEKPTLVVPGGGGINTNVFYQPDDMSSREPVVINPRGLRSYVRNDTFFAAIPLILEQKPETRFICPVMQGEAQPEKWIRQYGIESNVELLPRQTPQQMADLYRSAVIAVSPSEHDGTPNTLLEAMACGCFPVAGDIESVREWITDGENGLLIDPSDSQKLADAVIRASENNDLRKSTIEHNLRTITERADRDKVGDQVIDFYKSFIK